MKNYTKANKGKPFEDFLRLVHKRYETEGMGCIRKIPTPFIPLRGASGDVTSCKVEGKSIVDYLGHYHGVPVAVEAKHEEGKRILFSRVQEHQARFLDDWCRDGAVGLILVSFGMSRFFAVPWTFWRAAREQWEQRNGKCAVITKHAYGMTWTTPGMASASAEQLLPEWEVEPGGLLALPYLEIIDRMREN